MIQRAEATPAPRGTRAESGVRAPRPPPGPQWLDLDALAGDGLDRRVLGQRSRILVLAALLATVAVGIGVHHLQNSAHAMGGRISSPKLAWLLYTVLVWGWLCPILAMEGGVRRPFRLAIGFFAASMWVRVAIEMPMLYAWMIWRPPYGMAHDLFTVLGIAAVLVATRRSWWPPRGASDRWMLAFVVVLAISALIELVYAGLFERAVAGATTGTHGLWFAAEGDPRFTFINRLTLTFDILLYSFQATFLTAAFVRPRPPAVAP